MMMYETAISRHYYIILNILSTGWTSVIQNWQRHSGKVIPCDTPGYDYLFGLDSQPDIRNISTYTHTHTQKETARQILVG